MNGVLQDTRYALRQMREKPRFSATVILILALAVGAAAAVFSVIDAVLIRPLPYDQPTKITYLQTYSQEGYQQPASYPEYLDWRRENRVFSALAGFGEVSSNLDSPMGPVAVTTVAATNDFFNVFGVKPLLGRTFAADEDKPGKNAVVVLSYEIWRQQFGQQRNVIGNRLKINGDFCTVIGVMPAGFRFPISSLNAIYVPLVPPKNLAEQRGNHWLESVARLKDGVPTSKAEAGMNHLLGELGDVYPEVKGRRAKLVDISTFFLGDTAPVLKILLLAVGSVLAIGCVNIAGLLLARGVMRERDMALRSAIGATRIRLFRGMLIEALGFAIIGGSLGVFLAYGLLGLIRSVLISALSRGADVQMSKPVLLVSLGVAAVSSVLASLAPWFQLSRIAPYLALKSAGSADSSRKQHRLRAAFVVTQVALALILLVISGLLLRALRGLRNTNLGFNPDHLLTTKINLSPHAYTERDLISSFYQPMIEKTAAIAGVRAVGLVSALPIRNLGINSEVSIVGHPPARTSEDTLAEFRLVTPGYYKAFGIELLRGRLPDEKIDTRTSPAVAVVNEAFVRKFFAEGEDPIGQQIDTGSKAIIVGVVQSIQQNLYEPPLAEMDFAISQIPKKEMLDDIGNMWLVVRTDLGSESVVPALRRVFSQVDPALPFRQPETMRDIVADRLVFERLQNWLFGTFAFLAVSLAIVGLCGLVSHEVELSTKEIGIRMALGATRTRVLKGTYRRVGTILLIGVATGLLATAALKRLITSVLTIQPSRDAAAIAALVAGLILVALAASVIPARRAMKVDPMVALRYE